MSSIQSAYRQAGHETGFASGHVHFASDVSIIQISVNYSEANGDDQDNKCPDADQTRTSPIRHERPQLIRKDALEPDFLESPNHGIQSRSLDEPLKT